MGNLATRVAALEKKRGPTEGLPFKPISLEETERFLAEVIRAAEEKDKVEATLTIAERLALRRKELQALDEKIVFTDARFRVICEFTHTAHRNTLLSAISQLERQMLDE